MTGPNLHRQQNRRRNQVLGSLSYFKDGLAGSHDFKFGGEVFHETFFEEFFPTSYGNQSISYKRNGAPSEVELFDPGAIEATLMTYSFYANDTWRINNRLTLTPGLRFDRFVNSLPEQSHPAGRFSATPITFAAVDDLVSWNLFGPRIGITYDLSGNGRTVAEVQLRAVLVEPEQRHLDGGQSRIARRGSAATRGPIANGNGSWDEGEQGNLLATQGGVASTVVDPNLENTYTREYLRPGSSASWPPTSASAPAS